MCRAPFDLPMYRVRVTIEPEGTTMETVTSNISNISDIFGLDTSHIENFFTDIRFAVQNLDVLNEILREIGFGGTSSNLSSTNTVGTTEL
jgi:predicted Ser/Thr protein kinase